MVQYDYYMRGTKLGTTEEKKDTGLAGTKISNPQHRAKSLQDERLQ
jgi:hypothetical protein